jgi:uncharacterized protein (TIGR02757 family)
MNADTSFVLDLLNEAYDRLKNEYWSTSVLGPVRAYAAESDVDKEFWALFCALIDFQMPVKSVLNPMLFGLLTSMEETSIKFIHLIEDTNLAMTILKTFSWKTNRGAKKGFTHRFVKIENLIVLLQIFKEIIHDYVSLRNLVEEAYKDCLYMDEPMEGVLAKFLKILVDYGGRPPLIPTKMASTLKRFNLFFRWMVRPYPDLGLWSFIDKKELLVSLDGGLCRVLNRAFSLPIKINWHGVLKATKFFRSLNPDDPVKYDYILSRLAIMDYCTKELRRSKCFLCPLANICKFSRVTYKPKAKALRGKEREIFEKYLKIYGHEIDSVITEFPLGRYSADAVLHKRSCKTYVVEVEHTLNYNAIGQIVAYRFLYFKIHGKMTNPMIICLEAPKELKEICETEQGIEVLEIK